MNKRRVSNQPVKVASAQKLQGRRPTPRSERTRLEVLHAAAECIAREGYTAASTIRIAEHAGVSWGVLQYHFGDKDNLMAAVLDYGVEQTEARFSRLITSGIEAQTLVERLRILTHEAWKVYSSPLARAATEVVINNRNQWREHPERRRYLLDLNKRQFSLVRQAMFSAIGDEELAQYLSGIFLATLQGMETRLLQFDPDSDTASPTALNELEVLVQIMANYCEHHPSTQTESK